MGLVQGLASLAFVLAGLGLQLEAYIPDQAERLSEEKEKKEMKRSEEGADLRGQLYELQGKDTEAMRQMKRASGAENDKSREVKHLEDANRTKEAASFWERRVEDVKKEANKWVLEQMGKSERMEWALTQTGECYHQKNVDMFGDQPRSLGPVQHAFQQR